ncbi:hypothetical protein [Phytomonospora endophytica]|uniref:hypothetical protein n=1 Tax=Phytomonospora endophytica TaxID=714109 RepID=UPI001612F76D|nr:hypothetical protein [Phytomonospora endophytica]
MTWFRDFCDRTRAEVQAIPDQVTRGLLPIGSFGGADAPWAQQLMDNWNAALLWRKNEASTVAKELQYHAQALDQVAKDYQDTDDAANETIDPYRHF